VFILQQHTYVEYEIDDTAAIAVSSNPKALADKIQGNWDGNKLVVYSELFDGTTVDVNHAEDAEWFTISEIEEI